LYTPTALDELHNDAVPVEALSQIGPGARRINRCENP